MHICTAFVGGVNTNVFWSGRGSTTARSADCCIRTLCCVFLLSFDDRKRKQKKVSEERERSQKASSWRPRIGIFPAQKSPSLASTKLEEVRISFKNTSIGLQVLPCIYRQSKSCSPPPLRRAAERERERVCVVVGSSVQNGPKPTTITHPKPPQSRHLRPVAFPLSCVALRLASHSHHSSSRCRHPSPPSARHHIVPTTSCTFAVC